MQFYPGTWLHMRGVYSSHVAIKAKESLHPWVKLDQADRLLSPKQLTGSMLEGLTLNLIHTLVP